MSHIAKIKQLITHSTNSYQPLNEALNTFFFRNIEDLLVDVDAKLITKLSLQILMQSAS